MGSRGENKEIKTKQEPQFDKSGASTLHHPEMKPFLDDYQKLHNTIQNQYLTVSKNTRESEKSAFVSVTNLIGNIKPIAKRAIIINLADKDGKTLLMNTSIYGKASIAEALVQSGAQIDKQDNNGDTALMHSIRHNKLEVARRLIKGISTREKIVKCDINLVNHKNQTALDVINEVMGKSASGRFMRLTRQGAETISLLKDNGAKTSAELVTPLKEHKRDISQIEAMIGHINPSATPPIGKTSTPSLSK